MEFLGHIVVLLYIFEEPLYYFQTVQFISPSVVYKGFLPSHSHQYLLFLVFLMTVILTSVR